MSRFVAASLFGLAAVVLVGCGDKPTPPSEVKNTTQKAHEHNHDHDHTSGKALLEDAELPGGKICHAALEAHLSKKGDHELEVGFETQDKDPKPLTLPEKTKLTARVTRAGEDKAYELTFKPSPKDERKNDPAGQCSHFEADAKWMKPDDKLTVTLTIEGTPKKVVWVDFNPKKYSHEGE